MEKIKIQAEFFQRGTAIDIKNTGTKVIKSNDVVVLGGARVGVAGCEIQPGRIGSCHVTGVFIFEIDPVTSFALGETVFWDETGQVITATDTGVRAGWVIEPSKGDGFVKVKID